jgi:hypothetical protein
MAMSIALEPESITMSERHEPSADDLMRRPASAAALL